MKTMGGWAKDVLAATGIHSTLSSFESSSMMILSLLEEDYSFSIVTFSNIGD